MKQAKLRIKSLKSFYLNLKNVVGKMKDDSKDRKVEYSSKSRFEVRVWSCATLDATIEYAMKLERLMRVKITNRRFCDLEDARCGMRDWLHLGLRAELGRGLNREKVGKLKQIVFAHIMNEFGICNQVVINLLCPKPYRWVKDFLLHYGKRLAVPFGPMDVEVITSATVGANEST